MQTSNVLSELRSEYIRGGINRRMLESLIFQYLLDNFERYNIFWGNKDKWGDFVSWLYPRLSRAVDCYTEKGSSFDAYINSIIHWASKEYRAREVDHRTTELACWKARAEEMETCAPEPEYMDEPEKNPRASFPLKNYSPRQILILFLKSYYFVTDDMIGKVALAVGMKQRELQSLVDKLHNMRASRETRIRTQQERLHCQYYRYLALQKRLSMTIPGTPKYKKIQEASKRGYCRYCRMKDRYRRLRKDASNREIGEILHIPKGTVDSALFYIREKQQGETKPPEKKDQTGHS